MDIAVMFIDRKPVSCDGVLQTIRPEADSKSLMVQPVANIGPGQPGR